MLFYCIWVASGDLCCRFKCLVKLSAHSLLIILTSVPHFVSYLLTILLFYLNLYSISSPLIFLTEFILSSLFFFPPWLACFSQFYWLLFWHYYVAILTGPDDMPAHIKSSMFGCNLTSAFLFWFNPYILSHLLHTLILTTSWIFRIPITDGKLNMGTWQVLMLPLSMSFDLSMARTMNFNAFTFMLDYVFR